jgi:hypothetical protein
MRRLSRLCLAARTLNENAEVLFSAVPGPAQLWIVKVTVGDIIFVETEPMALEKGLEAATTKLRSLSQRTLRAVTLTQPLDTEEEPPSSEP